MVGKEFPALPSHSKRRRSPQERREELQGHATIPRVPQMSLSIPGKPVFPALRRLSSRGSTHTTVTRGTALWESLVGKPRGKASRESHRSLDPREGKHDTAATARKESARACPHSRGSTRVPPIFRGAPFPPHSSRVGILSLRGRERIPGPPVAFQEEVLSTGKARGPPGSCHHSQSPPDVSVHSRETCFPCTASTFKPRIDSQHGDTWDSPVGKPRGKASWESLEGKPQIP